MKTPCWQHDAYKRDCEDCRSMNDPPMDPPDAFKIRRIHHKGLGQ